MQTENRRGFFAGLSVAPTVLLAGCEKEPKPSSTATLFNNDEVHVAMKALANAVDSLDDGIQGFDTENWREVVPNVRAAAGQLAYAFGALRKSLGYSDSN